MTISENTDINSHVQDLGTRIIVTVKENGLALDISSASVHTFLFQSPSKVKFSRAADFVTDGTDGQLVYVTNSITDLNESGLWSIQVYLEMPGGAWHTVEQKFVVDAIIVPSL